VSRPWRAIVVDDNPQLLKIAARLLASIPGVEVVGEATSGQGALEAVDRLRPDLVLMDVTMPEMDGLEATRRLAARSDAPVVILMTVHDLPQYRDAALAAGARQFVGKSDLVAQLRPAILSLVPEFEAGGDEKSA
jgi:CheY-like chemotaxis protein